MTACANYRNSQTLCPYNTTDLNRLFQRPARDNPTHVETAPWRKAKTAMSQQDWNGAFRNLQTAITFEPSNAFFKEKLEEVKAKLK